VNMRFRGNVGSRSGTRQRLEISIEVCEGASIAGRSRNVQGTDDAAILTVHSREIAQIVAGLPVNARTCA
jgi:hypothetical protein